MNSKSFEVRWTRARQLEAAGEAGQALDAYEAILRDEPQRLYARLRASTLAQRLGQYRRSREHAVRSAEDVRDSRWSDLPYVTAKLLMFDAHSLVRELIGGADWNNRDIINASPILAQHLWLAGDVEGAVKLCETALPHAPEHVSLNYAYGVALGYIGRIPEARDAFERCLAVDPAYSSAYWSLAFSRRSAAADVNARLEKILMAMSHPRNRDDADSRVFLNYAAFRELDNAGRQNEAWKFLVDGAAEKRKALRHDPAEEDEVVRRLLARDGRQADRDANGPPGCFRPVFVVGMPRTGTTLLERILGNHAEIAMCGELTDFRSALNHALDAFIGSDLAAATVDAIRAIGLQVVGEDYMRRVAWRVAQGKSVVVDKHPENFFLSEFIMDALPEARIVCLRRRPMDACFSNMKELFANDSYGYSYDPIELADHYGRFDALARHWRETRPEQFFLLEYENLVSSPELMSKRVFEFLGMRLPEDVSDITRNNSVVTTASAMQVRDPINTASIGSWVPYAAHLEGMRQRLHVALPADQHHRIDVA